MKANLVLAFAALSGCIGSVLACQHESIKTAPPSPSAPTYIRDIAPIMAHYCTLSGCHNAGNYSNIPLETYGNLMQFGQVIPFQPANSRLYDVLTNGYMPQGAKLPLKDQKLIYQWIEMGASE